jgi:hypothetical protein
LAPASVTAAGSHHRLAEPGAALRGQVGNQPPRGGTGIGRNGAADGGAGSAGVSPAVRSAPWGADAGLGTTDDRPRTAGAKWHKARTAGTRWHRTARAAPPPPREVAQGPDSGHEMAQDRPRRTTSRLSHRPPFLTRW